MLIYDIMALSCEHMPIVSIDHGIYDAGIFRTTQLKDITVKLILLCNLHPIQLIHLCLKHLIQLVQKVCGLNLFIIQLYMYDFRCTV